MRLILKSSYIFLSLVLLCLFTGWGYTQEKENKIAPSTCLNCHEEEEALPEDFAKYDVHLSAGLTCADCHGGDPTLEDMDESMDEARGFVGAPNKKDIPAFCGKCHSNIDYMRIYKPRISTEQVKRYYTSVHGQQLKKGNEDVATCSDCHSAHQILPASDSRSTVHALKVPATCEKCHADPDLMGKYNLPATIIKEYAGSVHGVALLENQDTGAPACNDCHGNHGAQPPGVASISHVCGNCHVNNMQYFSSSKMGQAWQKMDFHACEECHSNHAIQKTSDAMVGTEQGAVCIKCHKQNDAGFNTAAKIHALIDSAVTAYNLADAKLEEVRQVGMDDIEIGYLMKDAHQSIIHARTTVHTFDPKQVEEKTAVTLENAKAAFAMGVQELKSYRIRRMGFLVATFFITLLLVALYFRIREMDKEARKDGMLNNGEKS